MPKNTYIYIYNYKIIVDNEEKRGKLDGKACNVFLQFPGLYTTFKYFSQVKSKFRTQKSRF
jgi:hypothetical protein